MPEPEDIPGASVGLALGVLLIALFLGLREWYERRARERDLSAEDVRHFSAQNLRRGLGVAVLIAVAALALAASRIAPRDAGRGNVAFLGLWLGILALIFVLLLLALVDLAATRSYARRHRRTLVRASLLAARERASLRKRLSGPAGGLGEPAHGNPRGDPPSAEAAGPDLPDDPS